VVETAAFSSNGERGFFVGHVEVRLIVESGTVIVKRRCWLWGGKEPRAGYDTS